MINIKNHTLHSTTTSTNPYGSTLTEFVFGFKCPTIFLKSLVISTCFGKRKTAMYEKTEYSTLQENGTLKYRVAVFRFSAKYN